MATRTWLGASADWTSTSNWSASTVPVSGDDVVIASGSQDITTNIDQNGVTLASIRIGDHYSGSIGTASAKLIINATEMSYAGLGSANFIKGEFTTVTVLDGAATSTMLDIEGAALSGTISSSGIGTLRCLGGRGTLNISAGALPAVEMVGASSLNLTIAAGCTGLLTVVMDSGTLTCPTSIATKATVLGGSLEISGTATAAEVEQYDGATVKYTSSGTLTTLEVFGGTFTMLDNTSATVAITNATIYEGATIRLDNALQNVNLVNPMTVQGGDIRFPSGSTITVA